jgi:transcriptional regulator with XRE-family HTH domain
MSRGDFVRLREIRKSKGISQLKMAMDLNMSQNTISRYETGEREPGINELIKIADYFNISIDYLLERTNNPNIQK